MSLIISGYTRISGGGGGEEEIRRLKAELKTVTEQRDQLQEENAVISAEYGELQAKTGNSWRKDEQFSFVCVNAEGAIVATGSPRINVKTRHYTDKFTDTVLRDGNTLEIKWFDGYNGKLYDVVLEASIASQTIKVKKAEEKNITDATKRALWARYDYAWLITVDDPESGPVSAEIYVGPARDDMGMEPEYTGNDWLFWQGNFYLQIPEPEPEWTTQTVADYTQGSYWAHSPFFIQHGQRTGSASDGDVLCTWFEITADARIKSEVHYGLNNGPYEVPRWRVRVLSPDMMQTYAEQYYQWQETGDWNPREGADDPYQMSLVTNTLGAGTYCLELTCMEGGALDLCGDLGPLTVYATAGNVYQASPYYVYGLKWREDNIFEYGGYVEFRNNDEWSLYYGEILEKYAHIAIPAGEHVLGRAIMPEGFVATKFSIFSTGGGGSDSVMGDAQDWYANDSRMIDVEWAREGQDAPVDPDSSPEITADYSRCAISSNLGTFYRSTDLLDGADVFDDINCWVSVPQQTTLSMVVHYGIDSWNLPTWWLNIYDLDGSTVAMQECKWQNKHSWTPDDTDVDEYYMTIEADVPAGTYRINMQCSEGRENMCGCLGPMHVYSTAGVKQLDPLLRAIRLDVDMSDKNTRIQLSDWNDESVPLAYLSMDKETAWLPADIPLVMGHVIVADPDAEATYPTSCEVRPMFANSGENAGISGPDSPIYIGADKGDVRLTPFYP